MTDDACRALVVEDEPANQDFFVRLIAQAGFEVCGVASAAEALQMVQARPGLAVVAIDLQLPDMSGLELLAELRAQLPDALLMVATMWDEPAMIAEAFTAGCNVFLVKPHGFMTLYQHLKDLTTNRAALERVVIDQYGMRPYRAVGG